MSGFLCECNQLSVLAREWAVGPAETLVLSRCLLQTSHTGGWPPLWTLRTLESGLGKTPKLLLLWCSFCCWDAHDYRPTASSRPRKSLLSYFSQIPFFASQAARMNRYLFVWSLATKRRDGNYLHILMQILAIILIWNGARNK